MNAITGKYQCAIYSDVGGKPSALLRATNGTAYWLAIWSNDTNARVHADNGGTLKFAAYPYGTWPNPVNLTGSGSFTYCIYATGPGKTAYQQWKQKTRLRLSAAAHGGPFLPEQRGGAALCIWQPAQLGKSSRPRGARGLGKG